jgi:hypothetical protein
VLSRRDLLRVPLAAGAVWALTACTRDQPDPVDPQQVADVTAVTVALAAEQELLAAATARPADQQGDEVAVLRAHVDLLSASLTGASPSVTASTPSRVVLTPDTFRRAARSHLAALGTVSGQVARMLASVAASDLALAPTLRAAPR